MTNRCDHCGCFLGKKSHQCIKVWNKNKNHPSYDKQINAAKITGLRNKGRTFSMEINKKKGLVGKNNPMFGVHRFGNKNPFFGKKHNKDTIELIRQQSIIHIRKQKKISKAEIILQNYLSDNKIYNIPQYEYKLGIADFYIPKINLIIECYGAYWHDRLDYIKRDKIKNLWLDDNGYNVLILNSEEITKNNDNLTNFLDLNLLRINNGS